MNSEQTSQGKDIEATCLDMLSAIEEKIEPPAKDALTAVVNWVANQIDDWDEVEEIAEEEEIEPWDYIHDGVVSFLKGDIFAQDTLTLYRTIRVTCPPEEVVVRGTAADIGTSWSLDDEVDDPTFLDQYGEKDGRDVSFVSEVRHEDVNWIVTIWKQLDPMVKDYNEIFLMGDAVPKILSVTDPAGLKP